MKRLGAVCLIAFCSVSTATLARGAAAAKPAAATAHGRELSGEIASVNQAGKSLVLRSGGKETTVYWTAATKVTGGALQSGQRATIRAMDKNGKTWATSVKIAAVPPKKSS